MSKPKRPPDRTDYARDPRSRPITAKAGDGRYVYAVDVSGQIRIVPDEAPHLHPKVLGHARPARYAGEMAIVGGCVVELTNCSGTFQFRSRRGLLDVAEALEALGLDVRPDAVIYHFYDRIHRPEVLPFPSKRSDDA